MSTDTAHLALLLDAPLQSWGFTSRFQRRTTGLHPTKSGVIGMICAAMGLSKGSAEEAETLPNLAMLRMTSIAIPRQRTSPWRDEVERLPVRRLEDYHTVGAAYDPADSWERMHITRKASSTAEKLVLNVKRGVAVAVVTRRQYLLDARFGVILAGDRSLLGRVSAALQDPVWGVWFGRKNCIPAEPIYRGLHVSSEEAQCALIGELPLEILTVVREVEVGRFGEGTDSLADQPVSFGDGTSSGPDVRQFDVRRIRVQPGVSPQPKE